MAKRRDHISSSVNKEPKVGVFMPCYNLGDYIDEAIESLRNQTYNNFEVIIADDASTDKKTINKLKKLKLPENFQLFFENKNLGMNIISNKYAEKIKADYFLIFSADDMLSPEYIKETVNFLEKNKKFGAVSTWLEYFGENTGFKKYSQEETKLEEMLKQNNFCGSAMMRKSLWDDIGGYDTSKQFRKHQDYDLWLSALEKGYKLGIIDKPLFYYRILGTSLSRDVNHEEERIWLYNLINKHFDAYKEHFPEIISHYYGQVIKSINDYRSVIESRDWLESEYHRLSDELKKKEATLSDLSDRYIDTYRLSFRRVKAVMKRILSRHPE